MAGIVSIYGWNGANERVEKQPGNRSGRIF